ncbi:S9 family peptidase [Pseudoduganella aquatica]|uniref:S9 family peptidase n=1 Tax=Pseudoduganella aquatica TaxID=2660641 RepID=UPI001E3BD6E7|nr:S9 family peptidase [Pseudoduganella aquatica]
MKLSRILPACALAAVPAFAADVAPVAAKTPWQETRHGEVVTDDYRWLQKKEDPAVIAYLNAENSYTEAATAASKPLADKLYAEIKGRMQPADLSVPTRRGNYYYYSRIEAGKQYQLNCRRRAGADMAYDEKAPEEILLDQNEMAQDKKYFAVGAMVVSPDERLMAYTTDVTGFRQYEMHVKDLQTGKLLPATMPRATSIAWASDNKTLFVTQEDATTKRSDRLFTLAVGGGAPVQRYHEPVEQFDIQVNRDRDGKHLLLSMRSTDTTEVRLLDAAKPNGTFRAVLPREKGHRYSVSHRNGMLYIRTDKDAKNFRIVVAPLAAPQQKNWVELVPHDKDVLINSADVFQQHLVVNEKSRALARIRLYSFASKTWKTVQFDDAVYAATNAGTPEFTARQFRISYQSPITPPQVLDVDMDSGKRTLLKQQQIVGGFDFSQYESRRLWATARDGVQVPLWIVYKKGTPLDGKAPLLLYGYGSYGVPNEAGFSLARLSLLERGVIYAGAQIRGGNDLGEDWHKDGMLMKKKNTFTDFIDSAEYLVREKWTSPERLVIDGRSAGGLLMGAVLNMRPELFRAAHVGVPFVDVMNTMMDASLPLTTGEYLEWGDPNQKAAYDYMRSYSPYDNIERKAYPSMLVTTGLNDSQVMYWEPAKYVAKLRAHKTGDQPLLLKTNMGAGHGGASGRFNAIGETAFLQAWMLSQWGIAE